MILDGYQRIPAPTRPSAVSWSTGPRPSRRARRARDGDLVVIAGKGHEDYQIVGDRRLDLDDRRSVAAWVEARHGN